MENGAEVDITTTIVALLVWMLGPIFLPIIVGLFKPGRRGWLTTTREVEHPGCSAEQAMELYYQRLEDEQFDVVSEGNMLVAKRGKAPGPWSSRDLLVVSTHAEKPLKLEIRFSEIEGGVKAAAKIRLTDFVLRDTGEGQYVDLVLDRLMSADPANTPASVVPNPSPKAGFAFYSVIFMAIGAAALPFLDLGQAAQILFVLTLATLVTSVMALLGLHDVSMKPKEASGRREALIGLVGCILVFLVAVTVFAVRHGGEVKRRMEETKNSRKQAALIETDAPTENRELANPRWHSAAFKSGLASRSGGGSMAQAARRCFAWSADKDQGNTRTLSNRTS